MLINTTRAKPLGERAPVAKDPATGAILPLKPLDLHSIFRYISNVSTVYATDNPQPDLAEEHAE
ncbi:MULTISPECIES: hypothetical protein [unclassified Pseudomonas]|uniref:hypothetical protein n=1 Tax=unclassified Pseudomonas TaxID=196821 RepID=UPI000B89FF86|nr:MULTISPECIES: hypothetical protein [unclassified Pseudomonas]